MNRFMQLKADMQLLLITFCWGISYVFTNLCLQHMSPMMLLAYRFLIGFVSVAVIFRKNLLKINWITIKYALICSVSLFVTYGAVTYGQLYTTSTKASFLCALTTILTPIIAFFVLKQKQEKSLVVAVIVCFIGIALMTLGEGFRIDRKEFIGDVLCMICALTYAINLLTVEKGVRTEGVDAAGLGMMQLLIVGLLDLGFAAFNKELVLPKEPAVWGMVLVLALLCTALALVLQPIAQRHTTASHVGVIYALEPVFSAIAAMLILHEFMTPRNYIGAALMLISIFIMEIDWSKTKKKAS